MSSGRLNNEELDRIAEKEERRFLSLLLKDKKCLQDAIESGIKEGKEGHFWFPEHRFLYGYICKNYKENGALLSRSSMESLLATHDKIGDEDCSAGMGLWDKIWSNNESTSEDYSLLKKSLDSRYKQWKTVKVLQDKLPSLIKANGNQSELVDEIKNDLSEVTNLTENRYSLVMGTKEGMKKSIDHITQMRDNPEIFRGIMCGIKGIDNLIHGFVRGSYTIITGMVNGGKSTLMFNMGWNMAKAGHRVIYVSIEKEAVAIFERVLSLHALIDYNRIKIGGKGTSGLSDYYYQKYINAVKDVEEKIGDNFIVFQEAQGVRLSRILNEANKIHTKTPVDVMIVDYLGVIGLEDRYQGRNDLEVGQISSKLQSWGKENRVAIITGMQFNNTATKEIRKKVSKMSTDVDSNEITMNTEDMGTSQKVVADCENNIGVALNDDVPSTKMVAHIIKARDNASHVSTVLDFDGKVGRISDPEFSPGQVHAIDDLIYNEEITEDQLLSDDGLFSADNSSEKNENSEIKKDDKDVSLSKKSNDKIDKLDKITDLNEKDILSDIDVTMGVSNSDEDFLNDLDKIVPPAETKKVKGLCAEEVVVKSKFTASLDDILFGE